MTHITYVVWGISIFVKNERGEKNKAREKTTVDKRMQSRTRKYKSTSLYYIKKEHDNIDRMDQKNA